MIWMGALLWLGLLGDGDFGALAEKLEGASKRERATAVRGLARLGGEEAWELVLGALGDGAGEVAETAQWELGKRGEAGLWKLVAGRAGLCSRDVWVRRRAIEAVGRFRFPVVAERLRRVLGDADGETRRLAAWSVERLARGGWLEGGDALVRRLAKQARSGRDGALRGRALFALAAVDPGAAREPVRRALGDRDAAVRAAGTVLLGEIFGRGEVEGLLDVLARDAKAVVRMRALEASLGSGSRKGARRLVARLQVETDERLLRCIVGGLQRQSGLRYRRDPEPWMAWGRKLPEDWRPAHKRIEGAGGESSSSFASFRVPSRRVSFLIDLSGSIQTIKADGRSRKQVVDEELREVLEHLSTDTLFNLIPFVGEPLPWQSKLVRATSRKVRAAMEYFVDCDRSGSGNVWDAIELALEDPDVDTLVIITDGAPTGGPYNRLELLVAMFLERNATRGVAVDSILVDAPRGVERHWLALAEGTGGRSLSVRLP